METLIGVIPGNPLKQNGVNDDRACKLFIYLWNKQYPNYPVKIKWNSHDFGSYPDIGIEDTLFDRGLKDIDTFSNGIEKAALILIEEWNIKVEQNNISDWEEIKKVCNLVDNLPPFIMEY